MGYQSLPNHELGERLRQARTAEGLTQEDAAERLGVSRPTLIAIEKGQRAPQSSELMRLAEIYRIAVSRLLSPSAIHVDFVAKFRAGEMQGGASKARIEAVALLSRLAAAAAELEIAVGFQKRRVYPPEIKIHAKNVEQQAEDAAIQFRHRLGLGTGPISDLVSMLELELGVWIFVRPLPAKISGVFAYDEKVGACMLLNANHPRERRYVTASHETGHFVGYRAFVEVTSDDEKPLKVEERFCNAFSYALPMPASGVRQKFLELSREGNTFSPRDLIVMAHHYQVSAEAMCRRLEDLKLLPSGTWTSLRRRGFSAGDQTRSVLGDRGLQEAFVVPPRLAAMMAEAHERGLYSEGQLCEKFALERVELRKLVEAFSPSTEKQ